MNIPLTPPTFLISFITLTSFSNCLVASSFLESLYPCIFIRFIINPYEFNSDFISLFNMLSEKYISKCTAFAVIEESVFLLYYVLFVAVEICNLRLFLIYKTHNLTFTRFPWLFHVISLFDCGFRGSRTKFQNTTRDNFFFFICRLKSLIQNLLLFLYRIDVSI
jgi:hypothetical protein